jgi:hypothetical protein
MRHIVLLFLAIGFLPLAGCETTPASRQFAELRFSHLPHIRLNVGNVEVVEQYQTNPASPHVEAEFPVPPASVAAQWARDRLKATGGTNIVRATVVNGAVIEVPLKRTTGVKGVFTTDQSERYDTNLELRIQILAPCGRELAAVSSRATRSRTVPENVTLAEREKIWFAITEALMNDLNGSLEQQVRQHFSRWIVR